MHNRAIDATWTYHDGTKHSYRSVRTGARGLDWSNQPLSFKIYSTLEPIPLPRDFPHSTLPALNAISALGEEPPGRVIPDVHTLTGILHFSAGITKRLARGGGTMHFRAAATTGALYHIELYVVCGDLRDAASDRSLPAGVYHFGVHDFALHRLRAGDYRPALVSASAGEPSVAAAPVILVCTTTYWRNAWKYRARAYRHAFWDSGTMLANLVSASAGYRVPARVVCGFVDAEVNLLLDLDAEREVAVALVALGRDGASADDATTASRTSAIEPLKLSTKPLSKSQVDYPAIRAMHAASSLHSTDEVVAWRHAASELVLEAPGQTRPASGRLIALQPPADSELPSDSIARVIRRRGSSRQFDRTPITFAQLSTILDRSTRGIPADFLGAPTPQTPSPPALNDMYLIVHAVDGLLAGAYVFHQDRRALQLLKEGNFRREAGFLDLEQDLAADASVNAYFLANLPSILDRLGNRGYRAAQLDAAIRGGRLYLAAYALRLGASGLTFYDDDVTEFFSPHAAGKSVMFLVALGKPARR